MPSELPSAGGNARAGDTSHRLNKHLRGAGVAVLHDLTIPGTSANIDHVCVGCGGVTVIDTKDHSGRVAVRDGELWIDERQWTTLIEGVGRQVALVRAVLDEAGLSDADVRGALSMANVQGLPLLRRLQVRGIEVHGPRRVAKLASRPAGPVPLDVDLTTRVLIEVFGR